MRAPQTAQGRQRVRKQDRDEPAIVKQSPGGQREGYQRRPVPRPYPAGAPAGQWGKAGPTQLCQRRLEVLVGCGSTPLQCQPPTHKCM